MSIVITTPTGNIGAVVTRKVLEAGEKPVLIARDPAKVQEFVDRGAIVIQGSHDDAAFLTEATRGAEALFVLTPTDYQMTDIRAFYGRFARAAAQAATANQIPHVVHLSSVGADIASGNGPVAGLYEAEKILDAADIPNLTHLRPGYFMENTLAQIPNILQAGKLFTTFPAGSRFPMIATRDIGERVADLLLKRDWTGKQVVELQGSGDTGYEEVAEILSGLLDRKIEHITVTDVQLVESLAGMGISKVMAEALAELVHGILDQKVEYHEPRSAANTTPTTYREFAEQVFKPAFAGAFSSQEARSSGAE
jgi:uncharacterized protein YbjT (DUF2867 family)